MGCAYVFCWACRCYSKANHFPANESKWNVCMEQGVGNNKNDRYVYSCCNKSNYCNREGEEALVGHQEGKMQLFVSVGAFEFFAYWKHFQEEVYIYSFTRELA